MNSSCKFVGISSIEACDETEDVYDIEVEETHNFFADNILVHNCVGGMAAGEIFSQFPDKTFDELSPDLITDPAVMMPIMNRLENMTDRFVDCVGKDSFFLELQFNKLGAQHLSNRCLLDLSDKTGIPLIATADSHFPSPDMWEARELYKKLGWMGAKLDSSMLPSKDDLKCMLYPKNAQQMWDEYGQGRAQHEFYKGRETVIKDAIERTHSIAWDMCDDVWIDTSVKLPHFGTKDKPAFSMLVDLVKEAMIREGLAGKPEYVQRMKEEMSDIKFLGYEAYFLAMYKIFHLAANRTLFGPGRGSGCGSLVNFLLGITQIDPLPHGLLWSRFLGRHRCLDEMTNVMTENGPVAMKDIHIGDKVKTHTGQFKKVVDRETAIHDKAIRVKFGGKTITCSLNHRWLVARDDSIIEIQACLLKKGDKLLMADDLTDSK